MHRNLNSAPPIITIIPTIRLRPITLKVTSECSRDVLLSNRFPWISTWDVHTECSKDVRASKQSTVRLWKLFGKRLSTAVRLLRRLTSVQSKRYTQTASGAARAFSPLRLRISATSSATPSRDGPRNRVSLFPLSNGALFRRHSKRIGRKPVKRLLLGQAKATIKLSL